MTREKWAAMSKDEQNAWLHRRCVPGSEATAETVRVLQEEGLGRMAPDYVGDLNDVRTAYYTLITAGVHHLEYMRHMLDEILEPVAQAQGEESWIGSNNELEALHNATSAQRAEALALTVEPE